MLYSCLWLAFVGAADTTALAVLGQADLFSNLPNAPAGAPSAASLSLSNAADCAVAPDGRLYVSDPDNHRVLSWPSAATFASGAAADLVFGQPDFVSAVLNHGGVSADSLALPQGLAVDESGNLWVCDAFNHRVLKFLTPPTDATPTTADLVLGQFDFDSGLPNLTGDKDSPSAASLLFPGRVVVRGVDVYISDSGNSRVLHYTDPPGNTAAADLVFGQFDSFTTRAENNDGQGGFGCCPSAQNLFNPIGIALDALGSLYIADWQNHRVLRFDHPRTSDTVADALLGQPTFSSNFPDHPDLSRGLTLPIDLTLDARGSLYIADAGNHRVLRVDLPRTPGITPAAVYGQLGQFTTDSINHGLGPFATDANGLAGPTGVALAPGGAVLIVDTENMRVLRYAAPTIPQPGDCNCDGAVTLSDIAPFVLILTDLTAYSQQFPDCSAVAADLSADGAVSVSDIGFFVTLLTNP